MSKKQTIRTLGSKQPKQNIKPIETLEDDTNDDIQKPIEKGCYVDPLHKISYVCSKFLSQNENYNENTIRIRLSADSTQISKRKRT